MAETRQRAALVVVADRRCAEFYTQKQRFSEPKPLFTLQASAVEGAVPAEASDQPGESFDSHGQGRHKMEPPTTLREDAATVFADAIAERMEETMSREKLDGLIVIAEPKLLGLLREEIAEHSIARHERLEIDKDLVGRSAATVAGAIEDAGGLPRLD
ncbi:host attachment protein [Lentisalinibacter salinarum]|uniref:host attachment protein n=1 Tax=Lentisalinibacter salinarum TaxID=2992239 RepID=UPI003867DDB6